MLLEAIRRRSDLKQLGRDVRGAVGVGIRQDQNELVAAQTGDGVLVTDGAGQALRDFDQQLVANAVTQRIIDVF